MPMFSPQKYRVWRWQTQWLPVVGTSIGIRMNASSSFYQQSIGRGDNADRPSMKSNISAETEILASVPPAPHRAVDSAAHTCCSLDVDDDGLAEQHHRQHEPGRRLDDKSSVSLPA
jgi:hypothetical protein